MIHCSSYKWAVAAVFAAAAGGAMAASTWTATVGSCGGTMSSSSCSNVAGVVDSVTAIGTSSSTSGSSFVLRDLSYYSGGIGIDPLNTSEGSPEHAIDNNGGIDAVLMKFDSSVILNQVTLGWRYNDWDFSVFAYTGPSAVDTSALKLNNTLGGGWTLVSTYGAAGGCTSGCSTSQTIDLTKNAGTESVSSSWWVISAYASAYGSASNAGEGAKDYFKLLTVAGTMSTPSPGPGVPEPASLALIGVALVGAAGARRRLRAR